MAYQPLQDISHLLKCKTSRWLDKLQPGVSLVELMVALSLFAVMAAGAFAALSVFDQIQGNQISQKNTLENQRRDFLQSYDKILKKEPLPTSGTGLQFIPVPTSVEDCRFFDVDEASSTVSFYTSDNMSNADAAGCPAHMVMQQAYNLSTSLNKSVFFGISTTGKVCEGRFDNASNFDAATNLKQMTVIDPNCLRDADGNILDNGTILFPEYLVYDSIAEGTAGAFGGAVSTAIFFPFDRLTQPTLAQCGITSNLEFPITGFDIDGDPGHDSSDVIRDVTITINGGFDAAQDRLFIRNATDNDSYFNVSQNNVGDIIHTYTNISQSNVPTFPSGVMLEQVSYNAAQGFMRLTADDNISVDLWELVFDEVIYINLANSDDDPLTVFNPVDKEIVFSLGKYPARLQDGDYHFYHFEDCASANCIGWEAAFDNATHVSKRHLGLNGYLATVTSDEENIFISDRARSVNALNQTVWAAGWLGGTGKLETTNDNNSCSNVPANKRGIGYWYWVGGKEGQEKCTQFWEGLGTNGQAINVEGQPIPSSQINPSATTAWNCDNSGGQNVGDVIEKESNNKSLKEAWWYPDRRGRDNATVRYANWSGGSTNPGAIGTACEEIAGTIGEPNNCCSTGEHYLQMTGLPSGRRLWNDLHGVFSSSYFPGSWYEVRGYFIEWDTSQADTDAIFAREARLNTRRHAELCKPITVDESTS